MRESLLKIRTPPECSLIADANTCDLMSLCGAGIVLMFRESILRVPDGVLSVYAANTSKFGRLARARAHHCYLLVPGIVYQVNATSNYTKSKSVGSKSKVRWRRCRITPFGSARLDAHQHMRFTARSFNNNVSKEFQNSCSRIIRLAAVGEHTTSSLEFNSSCKASRAAVVS